MSFIFRYALLVFFCTPVFADTSDYIEPDKQELIYGRSIWMENCENCHGYGIADAPVPMRPSEWKRRVIKNRTLLYQHAIEGFIGEDYSSMPARGGNENLNDREVKAAVDYMLFLANYYINQQIKKGDL